VNNLDLWSKVEKTDLDFVKKVNQRGGYTAISPQYQLREATKQFGAYGKGFGLSVSDFDYALFESTGTVIHKAEFFYLLDGEKITFPISNCIQAKGAKFFDTDFAKKVETNTVSKALSKIGFNADVYMGMFENDDYLFELNNEQTTEKAANKEEELTKQKTARFEETNKVIEQINSSSMIGEVEGLFKAHFRRIAKHEEELKIALTKAKDEAKERLSD